MIRYLDGIGFCWIATDDEPTDAVVYETCVRGGFTPYSDLKNGVEPTHKKASEKYDGGN